MMNPGHKFTAKIKITDNTTSKTADIVVSNDNPAKLGKGLDNIIESCCSLINLSSEDLKEVQKIIAKKIKSQA